MDSPKELSLNTLGYLGELGESRQLLGESLGELGESQELLGESSGLLGESLGLLGSQTFRNFDNLVWDWQVIESVIGILGMTDNLFPILFSSIRMNRFCFLIPLSESFVSCHIANRR